MYSPAHSTTSLSDDDDDINKSAFFGPEADVVTPARWSSKLHLLPTSNVTAAPPHSPAAHLPPEILIHVLKQLHSPRDLYHSLLVSRAWCECSVELLWHKPSLAKLPTLVKMMRVLTREDQTFLYARFIRRLNFLALGVDLTDSLFCRLSKCVRLERLTLVNCNALTDGVLARVLPCCPKLVAIDLTGVTDTGDNAIVALASACTRLQGINLGGCKKVTEVGILALATHCPLLRRIKLSGVESISDESVSALARSCPLVLEIDLYSCKAVTDVCVRDLWTHSVHMREMRLSHCMELTDAAFPAPVKPEVAPIDSSVPNPFPSSITPPTDLMPPLRLPRPFEHLRMLDLTACSQLTDDAVDGIISNAPKIRNLVLAKCTQLTDKAVESICNLEKHLHYLHLGHAGSITDRSIQMLARSCTRLRYIDLANCILLTDLSVFELAGLQKLRRIGLVRVNNLTDEAVYALADRHATLERIHLSYCDRITVVAIHFLLQKLHKLTHLSLTGIPAFRRSELQQFCRPPPKEFNTSQRTAFCVYSGKGVGELRNFLTDIVNTITDEMTAGVEPEYDDAYDDYATGYPHVEIEAGTEPEEEEDDATDTVRGHSNITVRNRRHELPVFAQNYPQPHASNSYPRPSLVEQDTGSTSRTSTPSASASRSSLSVPDATSVSTSTVPPRTRVFAQTPIVEHSSSPPPTSDAASIRSTGTNGSTGNGAGFFRTYNSNGGVASPGTTGAQTPDLIFAEIGHGRGAAGPSHGLLSSSSIANGTNIGTSHGQNHAQDRTQVLVDSSNSYHRSAAAPPEASSVTWSGPPPSPIPSTSPTTRELQESVYSALGNTSSNSRHGTALEGTETDGRGRRVKRSFRNTLTAAEQYASSFLFGRGASPGEGGGPSSGSRG